MADKKKQTNKLLEKSFQNTKASKVKTKETPKKVVKSPAKKVEVKKRAVVGKDKTKGKKKA